MAWPVGSIDTAAMDAGTDSPATARAEIKKMADDINAMIAALNAALGVCGLDAGGMVATAQLPVVPATKGGTGQSAYAVGDILYASAAGVLTKLSAGSAGFVLTSGGAGVAPTWAAAGGGFASGTRMSFNQTSAPTGWTKDTAASINDSILRITTGTVSSGGSLAFSTWAAQTSVGATTLSESQIPGHTHKIYSAASTFTVPAFSYVGMTNATQGLSGTQGGVLSTYKATDSGTGGGGSHSHSISQYIKYHDFIIAQKD